MRKISEPGMPIAFAGIAPLVPLALLQSAVGRHYLIDFALILLLTAVAFVVAMASSNRVYALPLSTEAGIGVFYLFCAALIFTVTVSAVSLVFFKSSTVLILTAACLGAESAIKTFSVSKWSS